MAIEKSGVIDAVGIETGTGHVILTIADYLDWERSETDHLQMLQEKINAYLRFIESGELLECYPTAAGSRPVISLVARCQPSASGLRFLATARRTIKSAGISFRFQHYEGNSTNVA